MLAQNVENRFLHEINLQLLVWSLINFGGTFVIPKKQGLVVAEDILLDGVLDELGQLAQGQARDSGWSAYFNKLGAAVTAARDGLHLTRVSVLLAAGLVQLDSKVALGTDRERVLVKELI